MNYIVIVRFACACVQSQKRASKIHKHANICYVPTIKHLCRVYRVASMSHVAQHRIV